MCNAYFNIKDDCRKNLLKFLLKAITSIPTIKNPKILDVGCGSGVPTLFLADFFDGNITAIDNDINSIDSLEGKIIDLNLSDRITLIKDSLFDIEIDENIFDIIIAEGFLNVVGFRRGFLKILRLLKKNKYLVIHDEYQNHRELRKYVESNNCTILETFKLDKNIWWNDYFKCIENEIALIHDNKLLKLFKPDLGEIELFKQDSSRFESVYYVIKKN